MDFPTVFQVHRALEPLLDFKHIQEKEISNPYLFRGVLMVTTFVRSTGSRIEKASRVDIWWGGGEMEHPFLKKALSYCSGRVLIYIHSCFYKALKLGFPLDGRVTTKLGILTPNHFRSIVDSKVSGFNGSYPCHFKYDRTEGSK